ncbi:MAG: hypothetical protein AAGF91_15400 [Actinomycetota bacterium]
MSRQKSLKSAVALAVAAGTIAVVPTLDAGPVSAVDACTADGACAGGEFFAIEPARVFDSTGTGGPGRIDANGAVNVPVTGVAGIPSDGVLAVAAKVTIAGAPGRGFVSVRPSDFSPGGGDELTSLINFENPGSVVGNFGIIGVGSAGELTVDLSSEAPGDVRVIVDVFGWVATSSYRPAGGTDPDPTLGGRIVTQTPQRLLDTRPGQGPDDGREGALGGGERLTIPVRGQAGVPDSSNVVGVALNATGINTSGSAAETFLSISPDPVPDGAASSDTSTGNYRPGDITADFVIVPVNADGDISLFNAFGDLNVAIDVVGYVEAGYAESSFAGRIVPLEAPFRAFDTRQAEFDSVRLGAQSWEDWSFEDFAASVELDGAPVGAQSGLLGNLTGFSVQTAFPGGPDRTFMTLNPTEASPFDSAPSNSNLNHLGAGATGNMGLVTYGSNGDGDPQMVSAFNSEGQVHYTLDVFAVILAD